MGEIIDWAVHALKKKSDDALKSGDMMLSKLFNNCITMHKEGLITVMWEQGEVFIQLTEKGLEQAEEVSEYLGLEFEMISTEVIEFEPDIDLDEPEE